MIPAQARFPQVWKTFVVAFVIGRCLTCDAQTRGLEDDSEALEGAAAGEITVTIARGDFELGRHEVSSPQIKGAIGVRITNVSKRTLSIWQGPRAGSDPSHRMLSLEWLDNKGRPILQETIRSKEFHVIRVPTPPEGYIEFGLRPTQVLVPLMAAAKKQHSEVSAPFRLRVILHSHMAVAPITGERLAEDVARKERDDSPIIATSNTIAIPLETENERNAP